MDIRFAATAVDTKASLVVGCFENKVLAADAQKWDKQWGGLLTKSVAQSKFKGSLGQSLTIMCPLGGEIPRVVVIGLGKAEELNEANLNVVGGTIYTALACTPDTKAEVYLSRLNGKNLSENGKNLSEAEVIAHIALGAQLRSWRCDDFKTQLKPEDKSALQVLTFITEDTNAAEVYAPLQNVAEGVFLTRQLVTYPPNLLYPETMANRLKEALEPLGVTVEILGKESLQKLGMGALLGVAQGSIQEPRVVIMQWKGADKEAQPLAFLGKGVTFDTGGISLKPSAGMEDMKYDMAGAAVVGGLMRALAARKARANVVGVVGLVENMPSGSAQRPSDIVTSLSGQTIEILNTDAEGRLVLADILWYTQERFKPKFMVNLATLTGAITIALGDQYAGLFSNNDELCGRLAACGQRVNEKLWRLPLAKEYDKALDSDIADVKNIGDGRKAGSITAAQFLQRFVNNVPWAHLDIAGVAWAEKGLAIAEKGATAFGVRLLDCLVRQYYEQP
jgi:leucyl aminopeptidase